MQLFHFATLALAATAAAVPVAGEANADLTKRLDRGFYSVPGLGLRKQAILDAGGSTLDLAISMLETEHMSTDYPYGDGKFYDAATFGVFKQPWGMLRTCASRSGFKGQDESQWGNGKRLNSDLAADIAARWDCQEFYGYDKWFGGHINGAYGLKSPYTRDIMNYKNTVEWIQAQIDSNPKYKTDDTRFWVGFLAT